MTETTESNNPIGTKPSSHSAGERAEGKGRALSVALAALGIAAFLASIPGLSSAGSHGASAEPVSAPRACGIALR